MLEHLRLSAVELSVALVDDDTMRSLNREYRSIDRTTDVLAFAMQEGEGPRDQALLGDVVISVPTAKRQAKERGCSVSDEVTMLLAHGLLHLLGHDHVTKAEERRMKALTQELEAAARYPKSPHSK
jgi:probable rRNA maturation factor